MITDTGIEAIDDILENLTLSADEDDSPPKAPAASGENNSLYYMYPLPCHSPKRAVDIYHRNASECNCGLLGDCLLSIFSDRPSTQFIAFHQSHLRLPPSQCCRFCVSTARI